MYRRAVWHTRSKSTLPKSSLRAALLFDHERTLNDCAGREIHRIIQRDFFPSRTFVALSLSLLTHQIVYVGLGWCCLYPRSCICLISISPQDSTGWQWGIAYNDPDCSSRNRLWSHIFVSFLIAFVTPQPFHGRVCSIIASPTELIKIRQQSLVIPTSAWQIAWDIYNRSGIRGLYRGLVATILREFSYGAYFCAVCAHGPPRTLGWLISYSMKQHAGTSTQARPLRLVRLRRRSVYMNMLIRWINPHGWHSWLQEQSQVSVSSFLLSMLRS